MSRSPPSAGEDRADDGRGGRFAPEPGVDRDDCGRRDAGFGRFFFLPSGVCARRRSSSFSA